MKIISTTASLCLIALSLSACGSDTKETTIVHDRPVVVQPAGGTTSGNVESDCNHGYDNRTHSCY